MGVELFLVQPPDDEHTSHTVVKVEQDEEEYADSDASQGTVLCARHAVPTHRDVIVDNM